MRVLASCAVMVTCCAFLSAAVPQSATAQSIPTFLNGIIQKVQTLNAWYTIAWPRGNEAFKGPLHGGAFEATIELPDFGCVDTNGDGPNSICSRLGQLAEVRDSLRLACIVANLGSIERDGAMCEKNYPPLDLAKLLSTGIVQPRVGFELGLAYGRLTGFRDIEDTLAAVRSDVEEFPSFTIYGALNPGKPFSPYLGLRAGVTRAEGLRARLPGGGGSYSGGSPVVFHYGAVIGLAATPFNGVEFFVDGGFLRRGLRTIDWVASDGKRPSTLPVGLPESLRLHTWGLSFGVLVGTTTH